MSMKPVRVPTIAVAVVVTEAEGLAVAVGEAAADVASNSSQDWQCTTMPITQKYYCARED